MAQELEIYKILATMGVALAAASITAYSIAITVLGSKRAGLQAKRDDILRRADEKFGKGEIKNLKAAQKEVETTTSEIEKIRALLSRLSLTNVVIIPGIMFVLSVYFAVQGISDLPKLFPGNGPVTYVQFSTIVLILGTLYFVSALSGIEKAAGEPRPVTVVREPMEQSRTIAYYFVDTDRERLVVDWDKRVAYWFDDRIDQAHREHKITALAVAEINAQAFVDRYQLAYVKRGPTPQEIPL